MDKIKLKYGDWGPYNSPNNNERKAELPIMFWFMESYSDNLIEIGEVSDFYRPAEHTIYDLVNQRETTIVMDAFDIDYTGKNVISVSTIEHVGFGDYGHNKEEGKAIRLLKKIMSQAKNYLITFPIGFNLDFQKEILDNNIEYSIMSRTCLQTWKNDDKDFSKHKYNSPHYAGNAIGIITNLKVEFEFGD
jgi:hypothetical protein